MSDWVIQITIYSVKLFSGKIPSWVKWANLFNFCESEIVRLDSCTVKSSKEKKRKKEKKKKVLFMKHSLVDIVTYPHNVIILLHGVDLATMYSLSLERRVRL